MLQQDLTPEDATKIAEIGYANPGFFCRTFLPHWFPRPMPWVHRGILSILTRRVDWLLEMGEEVWPDGTGVWTPQDLAKIIRHFTWSSDPSDPDSPKVPLFQWDGERLTLRKPRNTLLILPRGVSKTTLVNASNVYSTAYRDEEFIVYLSESGPHASNQLGNVKREFEGNLMLRSVFGNKVPAHNDSEAWSQHQIETTDGVIMVARGAGGQVRGMNINGKRPRKIVIDDAEDKESVKTDEQRKKYRIWYKADVEPALSQVKKDGEMIVLGTILHPDALIVNLSNDPDFATIKFGAIDPDGDPLWPDYMTLEDYERKKLSFQRLGQLSEFNMEYASKVSLDAQDSTFDVSTIAYQVMERTQFVGVGIAVDPAISEKKTSDLCAFGVVGITDRGRLHVLDVYSERGMHPAAQVDKYFEMKLRWECTHHGVEAVAYQRALIHLIQAEMFIRAKTFGAKIYHEVTPIAHGRTGKKARIKGILAPRYKAGYITHQRRFATLETQMADFSMTNDTAKDDEIDVVAMAVALLDPYAMLGLDEEGEKLMEEDHLPPLDIAIGGKWQHAP